MPAATIRSPSFYAPHAGGVRPSLAEASAWCQQYTRQHAENFTVASWLLPRHLRRHFANIYAWCRWADDLADETDDSQQSLALLDDWETQLHQCIKGRVEHPIYAALAETLLAFDLPLDPFTDLLSAFRQDQQQSRYETCDELLSYCRRSANPVGRLILRLGRCDSSQTAALSDSICTGLQLVNCWQDVRRDWLQRGRIYLPRETMHRFGVEENIFDHGAATSEFRAAIAHEVDRAKGFLRAGWPLVALISPELRVDVELFIRGGLAVVRAIRRQQYDVLSRRPLVSKVNKFQLLVITMLRQKLLRRHGAPA